MFLNKNYVLANELVEKMDIHIANISMLRNSLEDRDDYSTIVKMNNCSFINKISIDLPNNIRAGINKHTFTDMSDKLPCTWFNSEFRLSERELVNAGLVINRVNVSGKTFYVFNQDFVEIMQRKIGYILNEKETMDCHERGLIDGYRKIKKNKYFTWYKL